MAMLLAASRSASALRTHWTVSFFIENQTFSYRFSKEPISFLQPPTKILRSPHKNVQRKRTVHGAGNPARFADLIPSRHYDEQIDIAVPVRFSVSIRSEQDDFVGLEFVGNFTDQFLDGRNRNAPTCPALAGTTRLSGSWLNGHNLIIHPESPAVSIDPA